jgi:hypothetical protein
MKAEKRRAVPLSKGLPAALAQLEGLMRRVGMIPTEVTAVEWELDHEPALGLRDIDPATQQHVPHQHDERFLVWRPKVIHAVKTRGTGATTAGSDVGEMRKTRQLVEARVEPDDPSIAPWAPKPKREKPKRAWPKRPFQSRNTLQDRRP